MSILSGAKKAAKFTFVSMPLSILGWGQLKQGNRQIGDLWRSINAPICPECQQGGLHRRTDTSSNDETLHPWECSNVDCHFTILAPDALAVREIARARSIERTKQRFAFLSDQKRIQLIRGHTWKSRFFWACATVLSVGSIYMLGSGAAMLTTMAWIGWSIATALWGLRWSYRAWQIETGTLYVAGSYARFILNERWLR